MGSTSPAPTSTTTITFPRRQWATRDSRLTLALTATAQIVWLPSTASPGASSNIFHAKTVPASRVAQLVRAGRLWVGADGRSVRLGVEAALGGKACLKSGQLEKLRQKVCDWACRLGLVSLDRGGESRGDPNNKKSKKGKKSRKSKTDTDIVLSHPPSPDGLYAPRGIPHARLGRVDCQLRFNFCADGFDLPAPLVKPKAGQTDGGKRRRGRARPKAKAKPAPKPAPKPMPKPTSARPARSLTNPDCLFAKSDTSWDRTSCLVDAALATFIGIKGRQVGARALDKQSLPSGAPALLDLAPAVWSSHLFRSTASRATHVPLIYRALSTFTNAQSPSLRRKAEALARMPTTVDQPSGQEGLATRIEEILLKGTLFEPLRLKPVKRGRRQEKEVQAEPMAHLPSPDPTTVPSSQESRQSLAAEDMEVDEEEAEDCFYDLDMGNLEHAFDLSQEIAKGEGYIDDCLVDYESEAGEAVCWGDIEAWTEQPEGWPEDVYEDEGECEDEDEDGYTFQDFNGSWSPLGYWDENTDERHGIDGQGDAGWEDIEDGQLEAALALDESQQDGQQPLSVPWCESEDENGQYMDIGELDLHGLGAEDEDHADEGIGMWHWRNEHEMIEHIL